MFEISIVKVNNHNRIIAWCLIGMLPKEVFFANLEHSATPALRQQGEEKGQKTSCLRNDPKWIDENLS